jgi:glycoside/pentoside/hexuronide:cation symporter, GPH family
MERAPERLPLWKLIIFALGQLGWSLASYGVSNEIPYFYMPPEPGAGARIFPPFIFEGAFIGLTIIGIITFGSRLFDAFTNPLLASWSDRSRSRLGRRRFFMALAAVPFSVFSVLVFIPLKHFHDNPSPAASWMNIVWLTITILVFYFFFVMYTAPYNALISELGHNPRERLIISTVIGVTWSLGFGVGTQVYLLQTAFQNRGMDATGAFQMVQLVFAAVSMVLMLLPVFFLKERRYAAYSVSDEGTWQSLRSSLKNRNFTRFLVSELLYNVCQTIIQIGLVYYVVTLLGLEKDATSLLLAVMFVVSFAFYPLITVAAIRWEKKKTTILGFALLSLLFVLFSLMGVLPIPGLIFGFGVAVVAALPIAIFTIVPNAIVADIAEADGIETGNFKAGMFFGVRSFESNLGISIANILFPSLLTLGMTVQHPFGIRMSAIVSVFICLAGMGVFFLYNERDILKSLAKKERLSAGEMKAIGEEQGGG